MRIVIDARFWGPTHTGLGVYTRELVTALSKVDKQNDYTLLVRQTAIEKVRLPKNFRLKIVDIPAYSLAEQLITKPKTLHLCYCLTPTGYLWSGYDAYFSGKSDAIKKITSPIIKYLRWYDQIIASRPDKYIAISQEVQRRITKYYGLESEVVYPPVNIEKTEYRKLDTGKFFLIVSRLVPNKRLDIAVEAFNSLGLPLKIVGTGREENHLKSLAKKNVELLGHLTEEELARYYRECRAVIVPGEEDFGIVAVEAQGHGKPVIAYKGGGALETVIDGKTGWFFDKQEADSLSKLMKGINLKKISAKDCIQNAQRFSKERFKKEFNNLAIQILRVHKTHV